MTTCSWLGWENGILVRLHNSDMDTYHTPYTPHTLHSKLTSNDNAWYGEQVLPNLAVAFTSTSPNLCLHWSLLWVILATPGSAAWSFYPIDSYHIPLTPDTRTPLHIKLTSNDDAWYIVWWTSFTQPGCSFRIYIIKHCLHCSLLWVILAGPACSTQKPYHRLSSYPLHPTPTPTQQTHQ